MNVGKSGEKRGGIVDLRIVFHGTGAKRIKTIIDSMGLFCQIRIVTADFCFRYLREMQCFFTHWYFDSYFRGCAGRDQVAASSGCPHFKYKFHASTSFITAIRLSISDFVFISVVHQSISDCPVTSPDKYPCAASFSERTAASQGQVVTNS